MSSFADALQANPAPTSLGDVSLRFEPSMLIGETSRPTAGLSPSAAWVSGMACGLAALGSLVLFAPTWLTVVLTALSGVGMAGSRVLEGREKRRRAFIVNFVTYTLRLDFVTPIAGKPRTMLVAFDAVRGVDVLEQADGLSCLTVDFAEPGREQTTLREVLAAYIPPAQGDDVARLQRVLRGAFGLGEIPPDSPWFDEVGLTPPTRQNRPLE